MKINKDVRSTVKPLEMDVTSSKNYVYIRSNIREEKDGDIVEYVYDEQILTKDEYNNKKLEEISNKVNNVINTTDLSLFEFRNYIGYGGKGVCIRPKTGITLSGKITLPVQYNGEPIKYLEKFAYQTELTHVFWVRDEKV